MKTKNMKTKFNDFLNENRFDPQSNDFNDFMWDSSYTELDTPIDVGSIVCLKTNTSVKGIVTKVSVNGKFSYYATVEFFKHQQMDGSWSFDERSTAGVDHLIHIKLNNEPKTATKEKVKLIVDDIDRQLKKFDVLDKKIDKKIDSDLYWKVYRELKKRQDERLSKIDPNSLPDLDFSDVYSEEEKRSK